MLVLVWGVLLQECVQHLQQLAPANLQAFNLACHV